MSDAAAAPASPAKKAAKKPKKPTKPADHPKYNEMIAAAVTSLKERGGSSRQAILKYVMANYKVGNEVTKINARVKTALKSGVKAGTLKQPKGTGASGSFRLGDKKVTAKPAAKKPKAAKKPAAKKAAKPKKAAAKKPKSPAKKAAKPKKAAKSPAKKAAKPKKVKTPKKAAAKKPAKK
ncbi:hypothetical protein ACOMHN_045222 [Nucella lapillus]